MMMVNWVLLRENVRSNEVQKKKKLEPINRKLVTEIGGNVRVRALNSYKQHLAVDQQRIHTGISPPVQKCLLEQRLLLFISIGHC